MLAGETIVNIKHWHDVLVFTYWATTNWRNKQFGVVSWVDIKMSAVPDGIKNILQF